MANMLRKTCSNAFGCCSHCDRKKANHEKMGKRERRMARAIEKQRWRKQEAA